MSKYLDRRDGKNKSSLNRAKRHLLDFYRPLEETKLFKDNEQYLGASSSVYLDLIDDVKDLLENPDLYQKDIIAEKYKRKISRLNSLRNKSEKKYGTFTSTEFLNEYDISDEEETIIFLLLAKNGIGVEVTNPTLSGEVIITCLQLLHDTPVSKARRYLTSSSNLIKKMIIGYTEIDKVNKEIEKRRYGIREYSISKLLGEVDRASEIKEFYESRLNSFNSNKEDEEDQLIEPLDVNVEFEDVILPPDLKDSILATVNQVNHQKKFYKDWGMEKITANKSGISLLFSGPSGTGKTMMAKAIGSYMNKRVYYLPFDKLLNSFFGQTEKNVQKLFDKINEKEGILIIDEAEGILKKRSSSNSAADSTENRIVDIFVREMEKHSGIIVFTTNYSIEMDKALSRRFDLRAKFPRPNAKSRKEIWKSHIPNSLPLYDNVDLDKLARKYEVTGGQIKNAILNAGRKALLEGREYVNHHDFVYGVEKETDSTMDYSLHDDFESEEKRMIYN